MSQARKLRQFYTNPAIASRCIAVTLEILARLNLEPQNHIFLEPSAGTGSFLKALKEQGITNIISYDIDPRHPDIQKADFLTVKLFHKNHITIGNPPFGRYSKLAIDFLNKSLDHSLLVAFILPKNFATYKTQKQIRSSAKLIYQTELPEKSFTHEEKPFSLPCLFQIWSSQNLDAKNLRQTKKLLAHLL